MEKYALEVVMSWGGSPLASELLETPRSVTIGSGEGAEWTLPEELMEGSFELVAAEGDGYALRIPAGASARMVELEDGLEVIVDLAAIASDAEGVRTVPLSKAARAEVEFGAFAFHVRGTDAPEKTPLATITDWTPARYIGASFAFHALMLGIMTFSPPAASALNIDLDAQRASYIRASMEALEQQTPELDLFEDAAAGAPSSEGQPMTGDEGRTGAEDETRHTGGGVAVRGHDEEQRVPLDADSVRNAGVLGALSTALTGMHDISSPYGAANAAGFSEESLYGPLMADNAGFGPGTGGFGMLGRGRGGCPAGRTDCAAGTVGVGTLGTVGTIGATCDSETFARYERQLGRAEAIRRCSGPGGHYGEGVSHLGNGRHRVPHHITTGPIDTRGGLSREMIRRVVRRHLPQVRYCYEQALQQRPDLEGRVAVRFIINGDGAVQTAVVQETTLRNSRVESCVSGNVQRWSFPQTGELTIVTYPFRFQSQG